MKSQLAFDREKRAYSTVFCIGFTKIQVTKDEIEFKTEIGVAVRNGQKKLQ